MKFETKYRNSHSRKCISKCCLQNGGHLYLPQCDTVTEFQRGQKVDNPLCSESLVGWQTHIKNTTLNFIKPRKTVTYVINFQNSWNWHVSIALSMQFIRWNMLICHTYTSLSLFYNMDAQCVLCNHGQGDDFHIIGPLWVELPWEWLLAEMLTHWPWESWRKY